MSATLAEAIDRADWLTRYALDRLSSEPRHLSPGVGSHLKAAQTQLRAAMELVKPEHDVPELIVGASEILNGSTGER